MTKIKPCDCRHAYQDAKFGEQNRAHNERKGPNKDQQYWRCTVCGKET